MEAVVLAAGGRNKGTWNSYDASVLKGYSDPLNTEVSSALLLHLASAKRAGITITVHDTEVLHLEDSIAIVETSISAIGKPETIWHLLQQTNGTWKVAVGLFPID